MKNLQNHCPTRLRPYAAQNICLRLYRSICLLLTVAALLTLSSASPVAAQSNCATLDTNVYYTITAKHSGKALAVANASQADEASIVQQSATGATNQKWHLSAVGNNRYHVLARHSGRAISVYGYQGNDNANVGQANPSNNSNDNWCFEDVGGGDYRIIVEHSGKALTVANASQSANANVVQFSINSNADNQKWRLNSQPKEGTGTGVGNLTYGSGQVSKVAKLMLDFPANAGNAFGMNNGVMVNGHLVGVFATDHGFQGGGLDVYNVSDPHLPTLVGRVQDPSGATSRFRETHAIGTLNQNGNNYVIFNNCCGLEIWNVNNPQNPTQTSFIDLPELGFGNYSNNAWQLFVQAPYVYVAGAEKGLFVVDISNPNSPQLIKHLPISTTGGFRIGPVYALGNRLIISSMGFPSVDGFSILNIDDPTDPQLIYSLPTVPEYYTICTNGSLLAFANTSTSQQHIYDISSDSATLLSNSLVLEDPQYCAFQDDHIFWSGETIFKVNISDPANPVLMDELSLNVFFPDHSQVAPMGNLFWAGNDHGTGNGFMVHQAEPDTRPPSIYTVNPANNKNGVSRCSPIGIAFSDYIDLATVNDQTFVVRPVGGQAINGTYSSMMSMVNFVPNGLLQPNTSYEIFLPNNGIKDIMGNGLANNVLTTFTTAQNSGCQSETVLVLEAGLNNIAPQTVNSAVNMNVSITNNTDPNPQVSWSFGDGTSTGFSSAQSISHGYTQPGHYQLIVTVRDGSRETTATALVTIHHPITGQSPSRSHILVHDGNRLFVANQDNDTLTAISDSSLQKLWEVPTGNQPRSVAIAPNGNLWVANELSDTITIHSSANGAILNTIGLDYGTRPFGITFAPNGSAAYLSLYGSGDLLKLNPSGSVVGQLAVGSTPRGISISADSARLFVTRFISPDSGGQVVEVNPNNMNVVRTFTIAPDTTTQDSDSAARGIANYLDSVAITPDGLSAWVSAKKDNIFRGLARDGQSLTFETSVRAMTAKLNLANNNEDVAGRVDYDNATLPGGVAFTPLGDYAFVPLKGNNLVSIRDRFNGVQVGELVVEQAPDDLVLNADGSRVYVHNFLSRSVSVYDVTGFRDSTNFTQQLLGTVSTVGNEKLSSQILQGKQVFYDANDQRMTNQGYMSCASCHVDGDQDGRTWDLTQQGEGLRNTIDLNGVAGMGHGLLHWSGNFDEVQDFENQIRTLHGGAGFMSNSDFAATQSPLGSPKSGKSSELDALAAYVSSLADSGRSPHRTAGGSLTGNGSAGRILFETNGCASCHMGDGYTDSSSGARHNIGTIQSTSGSRLGGTLDGLDTPTLRGLWRSAPYLHDGSAATLEEAINAHNGVSFNASEMANMVAFLNQLDESESGPTSPGNNDPVLTNPGAQTYNETDTVSLQIAATDADNDALTFSATGLPSGLSMNSNSGQISGTPSAAGSSNSTISVNDGNGGTDSVSFVWTINGSVADGIFWERWTTIFGSDLATLRNDADFPNSPAETGTLPSFASAVNQGDTFGQRISGVLYPPQTGEYTFWLASDDQGELWLSNDSSPANGSVIASVFDYAFWQGDFNRYASQKSASITLQAGQGYYIEAIAQEGGGNDYITVAWQVPGGSREVIDGQHFIAPTNPQPTNTPANTPTNTPMNTPTPPPAATNTPTPPPAATSTPTPPLAATNTPTPLPAATSTPTSPPVATNTPAPTSTPTVPVGSVDGLSVYENSLANGWRTGNWGAVSNNINNSTPVYAGSSSIAFQYDERWATYYLLADQPLAASDYASISLWVYGDASGSSTFTVSIMNSSYQTSYRARLDNLAAGWQFVYVPLTDLGPLTDILYILLDNPNAAGQPTIYIDDIVLEDGAATGAIAAASLPFEIVTDPIDSALRFDGQENRLPGNQREDRPVFLPFMIQ